MSLVLRPANDRGHANLGWLNSHHTFSFAHYYDPAHMGFRALRVINDDVVRPGTGFDTHGHRDMEIISYVLSGALAHRDSSGGEGVLQRGDVQYMSAGTGIRHSEFNATQDKDVHFLQIWIVPPKDGLPPSYDQVRIACEDKRNTLYPIAGRRGAALPTHQDVAVMASLLDAGHRLAYDLDAGRGVWIQLASGSVTVNGVAMKAGDGLAAEDVARLEIIADNDAELLLFDLA